MADFPIVIQNDGTVDELALKVADFAIRHRKKWLRRRSVVVFEFWVEICESRTLTCQFPTATGTIPRGHLRGSEPVIDPKTLRADRRALKDAKEAFNLLPHPR